MAGGKLCGAVEGSCAGWVRIPPVILHQRIAKRQPQASESVRFRPIALSSSPPHLVVATASEAVGD